jgi:hypothetical protein
MEPRLIDIIDSFMTVRSPIDEISHREQVILLRIKLQTEELLFKKIEPSV